MLVKEPPDRNILLRKMLQCSSIITWSVFSKTITRDTLVTYERRRDFDCLSWYQMQILCSVLIITVLYEYRKIFDHITAQNPTVKWNYYVVLPSNVTRFIDTNPKPNAYIALFDIIWLITYIFCYINKQHLSHICSVHIRKSKSK